ncbi:MAG: ABC transporter transmembrane domain-containing protein, partial [Alphaproteobacteria bacterium]
MNTAARDRGNEVVARIEREAGKRPGRRDVRPLRQLLPFVTRYPRTLAGAAFFLLAASGATLALPWYLGNVVSVISPGETPDAVSAGFLPMFGVVIAIALASALRFYFVSRLGERVVADLRKAVYDHVIALSPAFFEKTRTGEVLSRLTTDTTLIQTVIGSSMSLALRNTLIFFGSFALLFIISPTLSVLFLLAVPFVLGPVILLARVVRKLSRASQDRVADTSSHAGESLAAVRTVQAFTHEDTDRRDYGGAVEEAFRTALRRIGMRSVLTTLAMFLSFAAILGVLWVGALRVINGDMSGTDLTRFVFYAALLGSGVAVLSEVWGDLQRAAGATERLMELLAVKPEITVPERPRALPEPPEGTVAFDRVTFHYPTRPDRSALEDFSLDVAAGETVALVGPSGAGKTTVFQLLLRFYDPQKGRVLIDGVPSVEAHPKDLRRRIAMVAQDADVFAMSALENIRYGRPEATDEQVVEAARAAAADEFISKLPQGYDTQMGERGVTLSGGQRQRIAIARAILRDAPILLLDEATSALDAENERLVQQALARVMRGRTTLVIAHRLATVRKADRIVVMDEGRIVAEGGHDDLVAEGGLYARLARLQF